MPRHNKVTREERSSSRIYLNRSKKRPNPMNDSADTVTTKSASLKKINLNTSGSVPEDTEKHYRIVDFLQVFSSVSSVVKCAECDGKVEFKCCQKEGLGFNIQVKCSNCNPRYIPSSEKIGHRYEINTRFAFTMRTLGVGLAGCNNPRHEKCPDGATSWCPYKKALATTGVQNFKHEYTPLPQDVIEAIKPIYEDLSKDELLERCVGGFTQNANESLNQLIWKIAPKKLSGSKQIVELASSIAACTFNEGAGALLTFLSDMGIGVGSSAHEYARLEDSHRISRAELQADQQTKEARILRRLEKKEAEDNDAAAGNVLYGAGIDDSV